ncbi:MAG TPA: hypothetical protein VEV82_00520 [Actinomycetota bacterium]|nr:hypothetical protein [Actinomycetota bacterium]
MKEDPNPGASRPEDNKINEDQTTSDLSVLANAVVKAFAFPLILALLVLFYLAIQYWLDRKDPKLAVAPVHAKHDLARFV